MNPLVWAVLLMVTGLALIVLEIFIPSGGILGFLAVAAVLGSIFIAFSGAGTSVGFTFVAVALVGFPTAILLALKWLPHTPIGRRLLLRVPSSDDVLPEDDARHHLHAMMGKVGVARSLMLPGGTVEIDGIRYEAVSEGGSIDAGATIEVVLVRNNRLVVRKSSATPPIDRDDPMSRPIDSLGIDPFSDPLS